MLTRFFDNTKTAIDGVRNAQTRGVPGDTFILGGGDVEDISDATGYTVRVDAGYVLFDMPGESGTYFASFEATEFTVDQPMIIVLRILARRHHRQKCERRTVWRLTSDPTQAGTYFRIGATGMDISGLVTDATYEVQHVTGITQSVNH